MVLPTLFKKTSTGALQEWTISVEDVVTTPSIVTRWGQTGGAIQTTRDTIKTGKNLGRANETNVLEQAHAEAQSQWEKKLKKGYVRNRVDAMAGVVDAVIEGGVSPMLAHRFDEHGHKIVYPCYAQPKFDGHRCIAVIKDGKATLWSRTRKPITGLPHIIADLERWATYDKVRDAILDGELYNHDYKDRFEELTSFIRNPEPKPGHEAVQYHTYDHATEGLTQKERLLDLLGIDALLEEVECPSLVVVETIEVTDEDELMLAFERFLEQGYEGLMVRNAAGKYVNKRSYDLQKMKEMADGEYEVVNVKTGRGKMADKAIFVCKTPDGTEFRVKMKGTLDSLRQYVNNPNLAIGKQLTVQYQGITNKSLVPRFPVGLRLKEEI